MSKETDLKDTATTQKADKPSTPAISLVMIAKDEEKNLPRALKSAKPWVDEIILVDTGSTDRTVKIAEELGAKVYHHPWEDDFSKHRNQALSYATGKWCLQLDADEELDQETARLLADLTTDSDVCGYEVRMRNVFAENQSSVFYAPRLFRKLPGVRYQRRAQPDKNSRPRGPMLGFTAPLRLPRGQCRHGTQKGPQGRDARALGGR